MLQRATASVSNRACVAGRRATAVVKGAHFSVEQRTSRAAQAPVSSSHRQNGTALRGAPKWILPPGNFASTSRVTLHHIERRLARTYSTEAHVGRDVGIVAESFERLGVNANVSTHLATTHPFIVAPTPAQRAVIPAILAPNDVILRAHTGTGKSFGILLALLAKPRLQFKDLDGTSGGRLEPQRKAGREDKDKGKGRENEPARGPPPTGTASLVLVPSNELAMQYVQWARALLPQEAFPSLDPVIQCLVRGDRTTSLDAQIAKLRASPPHIMIATPTRALEIMRSHGGTHLLGLETLRTFVLDEADALLDLPGRFPSHKTKWKHEAHPSAALQVLNKLMRLRATYSGGAPRPSAGLERETGSRSGETNRASTSWRANERRPPEHIRRVAHQGAERSRFAPPKERVPGVPRLQLVCASATANAVLRHFLGARTGWLRTGLKNEKEKGSRDQRVTGRWLDLTGLSGQRNDLDPEMMQSQRREEKRSHWLELERGFMPQDIEHMCLVIDEALPRGKDQQEQARGALTNMRNLDISILRKKRSNAPSTNTSDFGAEAEVEEDEEPSPSGSSPSDPIPVIRSAGPDEHTVDSALLEGLAFAFASEGVERGLALFPARWSRARTRKQLEELGVPVRFVDESLPSASALAQEKGETTPILYLHQATQARGLDLPSLSHVFLLGIHAVGDAVQYIHLAGRVSRIGPNLQHGASSANSADSASASAGAEESEMRAPAGHAMSSAALDPIHPRPLAKVITLLRGLPAPAPAPASSSDPDANANDGSASQRTYVSTAEQKMAVLYRRLRIVPEAFDLRLLENGRAGSTPGLQNANGAESEAKHEAKPKHEEGEPAQRAQSRRRAQLNEEMDELEGGRGQLAGKEDGGEDALARLMELGGVSEDGSESLNERDSESETEMVMEDTEKEDVKEKEKDPQSVEIDSSLAGTPADEGQIEQRLEQLEERAGSSVSSASSSSSAENGSGDAQKAGEEREK